MSVNQVKKGRRIGRLGPLAWLCLLLTGCSITPGNRLVLFPEGHRLTDEAKAVRQPAEPLPLPRELDKRPLGPYVVEPGDVLLVQPAKLDSPVRLPGDQTVLTDGTISLGVYGQVVVAGQTLEAIQTLVNDRIKKTTPDAGPILVRLISKQSKMYYVLGDVNAPGAYPLAGRETVLDGILAAGGLTDRASRTDIILARPTAPDSCRVVLPVCWRQIVQLGDTTTNYQLAPGDRIYVATRSGGGPFHKKKNQDCPGCVRPQTACPIGHAAEEHPAVLPAPPVEVIPAPGPAPVAAERGACPEVLTTEVAWHTSGNGR